MSCGPTPSFTCARLAGTGFPRQHGRWTILVLKKAPIQASQVQAMLGSVMTNHDVCGSDSSASGCITGFESRIPPPFDRAIMPTVPLMFFEPQSIRFHSGVFRIPQARNSFFRILLRCFSILIPCRSAPICSALVAGIITIPYDPIRPDVSAHQSSKTVFFRFFRWRCRTPFHILPHRCYSQTTAQQRCSSAFFSGQARAPILDQRGFTISLAKYSYRE